METFYSARPSESSVNPRPNWRGGFEVEQPGSGGAALRAGGGNWPLARELLGRHHVAAFGPRIIQRGHGLDAFRFLRREIVMFRAVRLDVV